MFRKTFDPKHIYDLTCWEFKHVSPPMCLGKRWESKRFGYKTDNILTMLQILFPSIITLKQEAYRRFYDVRVQLTISNIINKYFYINTLKRTAHAYFKMASILNILRKKIRYNEHLSLDECEKLSWKDLILTPARPFEYWNSLNNFSRFSAK